MLGGCLSSCQLGDEFNLEYTWLGIKIIKRLFMEN